MINVEEDKWFSFFLLFEQKIFHSNCLDYLHYNELEPVTCMYCSIESYIMQTLSRIEWLRFFFQIYFPSTPYKWGYGNELSPHSPTPLTWIWHLWIWWCARACRDVQLSIWILKRAQNLVLNLNYRVERKHEPYLSDCMPIACQKQKNLMLYTIIVMRALALISHCKA